MYLDIFKSINILLNYFRCWQEFLKWKSDNLLFSDWGPKIDVVGFCFLDLATNYEPPELLVKWLEAGTKPIYIGFGSLVSWSSNLIFIHYILTWFVFYLFIACDYCLLTPNC